MKHFLSSLFIAFLFSLASCSSADSPKEKGDTAAPVNSSTKVILQTDSGRLEIQTKGTAGEADAVLYDPNGKVLQKGMLINKQPAGAWVKYDANGNVLSASRYSNGKKVEELDKSDFVFRKWQRKDFGAGFLVPEKWTELSTPNASLLASFEKAVSDTSVHFRPGFNVARAKLEPGDSLESLAAMQLKLLHENVGHPEIVEESYLTIDSCRAFRRYGMYYTDTDKVGFLDVIIISGDTVWIFSCAAQNRQNGEFLKYQGVFQRIVESFYLVK